MIFATSREDLHAMAKALKEELSKVGLSLNAAKDKVLTTVSDIDVQSLDIDGEPVDILHGDTAHTYLGRKLCGDLRARSYCEVAHRVQITWMSFHKHRDVLMDKALSVHSRIKFFQTVITPTILFGLSSCSMTLSQVNSLDVVQRRMLRKIVGWTRRDDEP